MRPRRSRDRGRRSRAARGALAGSLLAAAGCSLTTDLAELSSRGPVGSGGAGAVTATATASTVASSSSTTGGADGGAGGAGGAPALCVPGAVEACYDGPAATLDVGACHAGERVCDADGDGFGPCQGDALPSPENCAADQDEDCDGASPPCTGDSAWARRFGGLADQHATEIAADAGGNLLVAGVFAGSITFGGPALISVGGADVFVAKLDPSGGHLWSVRFGGAADDGVGGLAVRETGEVVVAGDYSSPVDFGSGPVPSAGATDIFLVTLDGADGAILDAGAFGSPAADHAFAIAAGPAGEIAVTGATEAPIDFGGGLLPHGGGQDLFVALFDASGAHVWSDAYGTASAEIGTGVALDPAGHALVAGVTTGTIDVGLGPLVGAGAGDIVVFELDPGGAPVWSRRFGDAGDQAATAIAVDGIGSAFVAGAAGGSWSFGPTQITSAGALDAFVLKLDGAGTPVWGKRFGDAGDQIAAMIAVDPWGNALVTGRFAGSIGFGVGAPLISAGSTDGYAAKLDPGGGEVWARAFGDLLAQSGDAIASDPFGAALLGGSLEGGAAFDDDVLASAGGADALVARLEP